MLVIKQLVGPIDLHVDFSLEVNGYSQLFLAFFKISPFVFNRRKKLIQGWNHMTQGCVNNDNSNFWVNYPFNDSLLFNNCCQIKWFSY